MAVKRFYFFGSYSSAPVFRPFIIQINSGADGSFTIPTIGGGYNYKVSTSDGQNFTGVTGNLTITFPDANTLYDISISGDFPRIYFNNGSERLKIKDIKQWGDIVWGKFQEYAFYGCADMTCSALDSPDFTLVMNGYNMFRNCPLWDANLNNWNVSSLVDARHMFRDSGFTNNGVTLDWSDATTGSINLEQAHAFAYNTGLLGYKLQAGNIILSTNNNFTNSAVLTELIGMKASFYIADAPITGSAIDDLANSVADMTGQTSPTVTMTTAQYNSCDTSIWTNKNWTIAQV